MTLLYSLVTLTLTSQQELMQLLDSLLEGGEGDGLCHALLLFLGGRRRGDDLGGGRLHSSFSGGSSWNKFNR